MCTWYNSTVPTVTPANNRQAFCKLFIPRRHAYRCPAGSIQIKGSGADIRGCGIDHCSERYKMTTAQACSDHCKKAPACKAFSWLEGTDKNNNKVRMCTRHTHI